MIYLEKIVKFSSAHRLNDYELNETQNVELYSKCNKIHGHNYTVFCIIKGEINETGMLMNLTNLKIILEEIRKEFDHNNIDELDYFKTRPSTAENICVYWFNRVKCKLPLGVTLHKIKLKETDSNSCYYMGE